jgi:hypothetical protein
VLSGNVASAFTAKEQEWLLDISANVTFLQLLIILIHDSNNLAI